MKRKVHNDSNPIRKRGGLEWYCWSIFYRTQPLILTHAKVYTWKKNILYLSQQEKSLPAINKYKVGLDQ